MAAAASPVGRRVHQARGERPTCRVATWMARPRAPGNATWRSTPLARPAPDEAEKSERSEPPPAPTPWSATTHHGADGRRGRPGALTVRHRQDVRGPREQEGADRACPSPIKPAVGRQTRGHPTELDHPRPAHRARDLGDRAKGPRLWPDPTGKVRKMRESPRPQTRAPPAEERCKQAKLGANCGLLCKQEVAGSIPAGSIPEALLDGARAGRGKGPRAAPGSLRSGFE